MHLAVVHHVRMHRVAPPDPPRPPVQQQRQRQMMVMTMRIKLVDWMDVWLLNGT